MVMDGFLICPGVSINTPNSRGIDPQPSFRNVDSAMKLPDLMSGAAGRANVRVAQAQNTGSRWIEVVPAAAPIGKLHGL